MSLPMWKLDFSNEVKFYFIDSGRYTGNLLGEIHLLAYKNDPHEDCTVHPGQPTIYALAILDHTVYFTFENGLIYILAVKPD